MNVEFEHDLDEFAAKIEAVDMEAATERGMEEALKVFRTYIINNIKKEGLVGIQTNGNRGEGPAMVTKAAWLIEQEGDGTWTIKTHPQVAERAFYLEYGTDGPITPNDAQRLAFENRQGNMIYPKSVSGVEEYRFWRNALAQFRADEVMTDELGKAIDEEFRRHGLE